MRTKLVSWKSQSVTAGDAVSKLRLFLSSQCINQQPPQAGDGALDVGSSATFHPPPIFKSSCIGDKTPP